MTRLPPGDSVVTFSAQVYVTVRGDRVVKIEVDDENIAWCPSETELDNLAHEIALKSEWPAWTLASSDASEYHLKSAGYWRTRCALPLAQRPHPDLWAIRVVPQVEIWPLLTRRATLPIA